MKKTLLLLACLQTALVWAPDAAAAPASARQKASPAVPADPTEDPVLLTAGFLNGHPDLRFRMLGMEKQRAGDHVAAFGFFQRAGFYGDKVSQAMVAEMLWTGQGTAQDPAVAYAWMDLAAERGYRGFLELRERYWAKLTPEQQAHAISEGEALYARFGDAVAEPRLAQAMRREQRRMTGSRTGYTGNLKIFVPGPNGVETQIDGSKFYDKRYWEPALYRQWQDQIWSAPRVGTVNVGTVTNVDSKTRIPAVAPDPDAAEPVTEDLQPVLKTTPR